MPAPRLPPVRQPGCLAYPRPVALRPALTSGLPLASKSWLSWTPIDRDVRTLKTIWTFGGHARGGPRPASRYASDVARDLPGAARAGAAGSGTRGRSAGSLGDEEVAPRLRVGGDGVAVDDGSPDVDLTGARPAGETGGRQHRVGVADVRLGIDVVRLQLGHRVAGVGLRRRVVALVLLAEEARQSDRGKNADDQNDHEELDEGKALLLIAQLAQHVNPPWIQFWLPPAPPGVPPVRQPGCLAYPRPVALRPALTSGLPLAFEGLASLQAP